jgi:YHS domain-containing protein
MKTFRLLALALAAALAPSLAFAKDDKAAKAKPYPLKTCIVADDALDKDAYAFVYQGQEFKLCCESCKKDFYKAPEKFVKKLAAATKAK